MDAHVLVLQRPLYQGTHAVAVAAKRQGMQVIVELDDDLNAVHNGTWLMRASIRTLSRGITRTGGRNDQDR